MLWPRYYERKTYLRYIPICRLDFAMHHYCEFPDIHKTKHSLVAHHGQKHPTMKGLRNHGAENPSDSVSGIVSE